MAMETKRPILITGSTGQVGSELIRMLQSLGTVLAPNRKELDLGSPDSVRQFLREWKPAWIVNPAAYTAVDKAESERESAYAVNAIAPGLIGEEARKIGAAVLHFSTDYVFDGSGTQPYRESDATGPLSVYGASKLAGEQALQASGAAHVIVRTSWVYGATGKNFLLTVLRVAREREKMTIVDDQHGAPTWSRELARMTSAILQTAPHAEALRPLQGVYHGAAQGETTWYGFAEEALRLRRELEPAVKFAALEPIPTSAYPTPAKRPANSRLSCTKLETTFGFTFMPWAEALTQVLREIPAS